MWSLLFTKIFVPEWGWGGSVKEIVETKKIERFSSLGGDGVVRQGQQSLIVTNRSEERRVGKEGRSRWSPNH